MGEESQTSLRKKKNKVLSLSRGRKEEEEDEEEEEDFLDFSGEDSDGESGPSTPGLSIRLPNRKYVTPNAVAVVWVIVTVGVCGALYRTRSIATNTQSSTPSPRTGNISYTLHTVPT